MINISPFRALRPQPQFAKQVASRPYDVLNTKEAKAEAAGNPHSFLHVTKSEIDLPPATDIHSNIVYDRAKENLDAFTSRSVLFLESKPCYYIYELQMNGQAQTGLVCCSAVEDYENDFIKKHEHTRPEKEKDRIDHMRVTTAQTGNVFLAYRDNGNVDKIVNNWKAAKSPVYDFTTEDGIKHSVWVISDEEVIEKVTGIFETQIEFTYIADGHHRAASAAKVRYQLSDSSEAGYFLTTLFPSGQLKILPYNRVVKDLGDLVKDELLIKVNKYFTYEKKLKPFQPEQKHDFGMYLKGQWYKLTALDGTFPTDPIGILDISVLQNNLLEPILGIHDQRTDKRIDFVGGIRGLAELEKLVDSGEYAVAFSMFPVTMEQLFDIADSGNIMPPKSTWFEPKLRDGLLTHVLFPESI